MNSSEQQEAPNGLQGRVSEVLELMRPAIKEDGGDIELVGISEEGMVTIRFLGACVGCPSSAHTLHQGIERVRARVEGLVLVRAGFFSHKPELHGCWLANS